MFHQVLGRGLDPSPKNNASYLAIGGTKLGEKGHNHWDAGLRERLKDLNHLLDLSWERLRG